jgi:uncharacterized OsmC-like protein
MTSAVKTQAGNVINGLDVDALKGLIGSVREDPSRGLTEWRVRSEWQGQARIRNDVESFSIGGEVVRRQHTIEVDEPYELGGSNQHPNPQEVLMSALNSCMITGYAAVASLRGITLERLEIETSGEIDLRGFLGLDETVKPGYPGIEFTVRVAADAPKETLEEILAFVLKTSPNYFNISQPVPLKSTLIVE